MKRKYDSWESGDKPLRPMMEELGNITKTDFDRVVKEIGWQDPMKENKYYTPTIDEFYVGFECERKEVDNWEQYIVTSSTWSSNSMWKMIRDKQESFRVKYLDKEDIESVGFKKYLGHSDICKDQTWQDNIFGKDLQFTLYDNGMLLIEYQDWEEEEMVILFKGIIKNKSELVVLLKQLGICD